MSKRFPGEASNAVKQFFRHPFCHTPLLRAASTQIGQGKRDGLHYPPVLEGDPLPFPSQAASFDDTNTVNSGKENSSRSSPSHTCGSVWGIYVVWGYLPIVNTVSARFRRVQACALGPLRAVPRDIPSSDKPLPAAQPVSSGWAGIQRYKRVLPVRIGVRAQQHIFHFSRLFGKNYMGRVRALV